MSFQSIQNFRNWLKGQKHRQDPVGDFARDFLADPRMIEVRTISSIDRILRESGASEAVLDARDLAWREYARVKP